MTQNVFVMTEYRDSTNVLGPFAAGTLLDMLEDGQIDRDTALLQYAPPGFSKPFWTPISEDIEHDLLKRYRASMRVSPIDLPYTQVPAVVEVKQEDYFNPKIQEQAYYEIVGMVSEETDTSRALLVQIDKKFGGVRHGGDLWSWLDERATGHADSEEGLIDANEARREVDEYFFPECKITTEMLTVEAGKFENIYTRQPKERQGMRGDMFRAFVSKLPPKPFVDLLDKVNTFDLIGNGCILKSYDESIKMLRKLYGQHVGVYGYVSMECDKGGSRESTALGAFNMEVKSTTVCFRCWKVGEHFSWNCDKPGRACDACGNDGGKRNGFSCGGEYDAAKCMAKGYIPSGRVPPKLLERIKTIDCTRPAPTALSTVPTPPSTSHNQDGMEYTVEQDSHGRTIMVGRKII